MTCAIISDGFEKEMECKNELDKPYIEIKDTLRQIIWSLYNEGYTEFYSNCEYGVPLWSAEIICALKIYNNIKLHIVTPYEEQAVNWTEEQRDRYYTVHEHSDSVKMMNYSYYDGCYDEANEYMTEQSDKVMLFNKSVFDF